MRPDLTRPNLSRRGLLGAFAASAFLAGCGTDRRPQTSEATTHQVEDFLGPTTIPTYPERIVADSASMFANLVALQVEPVAVAVPAGISTEYFWSAEKKIPNITADDGWSINIEKALTYQPDLILATGADWNQENLESYREAVATLAFVEGWKDTDHIKERFLALGAALGREEAATAAVDDYDEKLVEARAAVAPVVEEVGTVGVVRFDATGFIGVRKKELPSTIFAALGLAEPAWPKVGESGYVELSLETLGVLNRADTLFVTIDDDADPAKVEGVNSPLWDALEPVKSGRAHFVSAWNGWDLLQLGRIVDDVVAAVTNA